MPHYVRAAFLCFAAGMLGVLLLNTLIRVVSTSEQALEQRTAQSPNPQPEPQAELDSPPPTRVTLLITSMSLRCGGRSLS
jgi:hypothetical protein